MAINPAKYSSLTGATFSNPRQHSIIAKLGIENRHVYCIIGVAPEQRATAQHLIVSLWVHTDIKETVERDSLCSSSVDSKLISEIIVRETNKGYRTIEALTYGLCISAHVAFPHIKSVSTHIRKYNLYGETTCKLQLSDSDYRGLARL